MGGLAANSWAALTGSIGKPPPTLSSTQHTCSQRPLQTQQKAEEGQPTRLGRRGKVHGVLPCLLTFWWRRRAKFSNYTEGGGGGPSFPSTPAKGLLEGDQEDARSRNPGPGSMAEPLKQRFVL